MSRKRNVKTHNPYRDVLANLEDIDACIAKSSASSRSCLEGILKTEDVLEDTVRDPDLHCVALVKKAELIFIAHQNKYKLEDLGGDKRLYSLEICIAECDRVIRETKGNSTDNPVYAKAKDLVTKAWKLKEDLLKEGRNWVPRYSQKCYDPLKTSFKSPDMINSMLLQDVVDCYKKSRIVCRVCYFKKRSKEPINASSHYGCRGTKKNPPKLILIPASKLCANIGGTSDVPILPVPVFLLKANRHKPFQICKNADHHFCDNKAAVGENRFAHSIEELVVWTIERHYECSFQEYIEHIYKIPNKSHNQAGTSPAPAPPESEEVDTDDLFSDSYSDQEIDESEEDDFYEFHPEQSNILFENKASIPQNLLLSVVECYRKLREYCKKCYYKNSDQGTPCKDHSSDELVCSLCRNYWEPVKVIPSSELCWNFGDFDFLPIAPWPNGKPKKDPFEYCKKKNHFRCFTVYGDSEFWYPHSVEEMVIWTVERELRKSFGDFIKSLGQKQARKRDSRSLATHAKTFSSTSESHAHSYSTDSAEHKIANKFSANFENELPHSKPPPPATFEKAVASESSQASVSNNTAPRLQKQKMSGPGQDLERQDQGAFGSIQGTLSSNYPEPPPNQGAKRGLNQMSVVGRMPGSIDIQQPKGTGDSTGGPNMPPGAPHMQFRPYQQMFPPGGPRVLLPAEMRPMFPYRMSLGGHPQNLSQQQLAQMYVHPGNPGMHPRNPGMHPRNPGMHPGNPGMHPGNPYFNLYVRQGVAPGGKPIIFKGGNEQSPESGNETDITAVENKNGSSRLVNGASGEKGSAETSKTGSSSNLNGIRDEGAHPAVKKVSGRKNYAVAITPPVQEKRAGSAGSGQESSGGGMKDKAGNDSGLGVEPSGGIEGGSALVQSLEAPRSTATLPSGLSLFRFSEVNFRDINDIPISLIKGVALCLREKKCVCRMCFFGERSLSEEDVGAMCNGDDQHKWFKPIAVIPGCYLCDNEPSFQQGEHIPIFPLPPVAVLKKCSSTNHHKCFTKALDKQLFQAHSVEELVVWLVESESEVSLETYASQLGGEDSAAWVKPPLPVASPLTSEPSSPPPSPILAGVAPVAGTAEPPAPPTTSLLPQGSPTEDSMVPPGSPIRNNGRIANAPPVTVENIAPVVPPVSHIGWNPMAFQPPQSLFPHSQPPQTQASRTLLFQPPHTRPSRTLLPNPQLPHSQPPHNQPPHNQPPHSQPPNSQPPSQPPQTRAPRTLLPNPQPSHIQPPRHQPSHSQPRRPQPPNSPKTLTEELPEVRAELPPKPIKKFNPKEVEFNNTADVPLHLLSSVAECFKHMKMVCRTCFFTSNCSSLVPKSEKKPNVCKKDHSPFKAIRVIPKSSLCVNKTSYISILPLPKHMRTSKSHFDMCKKGDHSVCYAMSRDTNPWFPHTIEELVVWIVERDTGQAFESIYSKYILPKTRSPAATGAGKQTKAVSAGGGRGGGSSATPPTSAAATTADSRVSSSSSSAALVPGAKVHTSGASSTASMLFSSDDNMFQESSNSQPLDDVSPLNPLQKLSTVDPHAGTAGFYMHSQQLMVRPPGYMSYYSSQPPPHVFPSFHYNPAGSGMAAGDPRFPTHPLVSDQEEEGPLTEVKNSTLAAKDGAGEVPEIWTGKKDNGTTFRDAIWHDEDPLPWGGDFQSESLGQVALDQPSFDSNDIVHQSQVEDDSFQPYASIKPPAVIPALAEKGGANPPPLVSLAAKPLLQTNDVFSSSSSNSKGKGFLASAMEASVNSFGYLSVDESLQDDIYHSRSNSPEDVAFSQNQTVGSESSRQAFSCLLCYCSFYSLDELKAHGSSDSSHLELCLLDSRHKEVWQHAPPPPQRSEEMIVCTTPNCVGAPQCSRPHSQEQLGEWQARIKHRQQRRRTRAHLESLPSPALDSPTSCVPMTSIPGLSVSVSEPNAEPNNGYSWTVHIEGQNWLSLFGLTVKTTSQWTFKVTQVESSASTSVFHPHSSMWRAPPVRGHKALKQCLLLGSAYITVKALPSGSASRSWRRKEEEKESVSGCLYVDLNYDQCFTVELPAVKSPDASTSNTVSNFLLEKSSVVLQLEQQRFSPTGSHDSHSWTMGSDFSDELGDLNIEGEDLTLQHVPIEEWGCSLTD